ncbi:SDR family oxidoreductase [Endozoicomonas arenosclerae]|uniref:SDR family oxidoreductase n=1 Tax=Endozoicomonas arenosclerae TaxID=1633495 RepID=UPI00078648F6|nr:SDR family oxidoreductase [Endozoicomonas arenosclerae]
METVFITGANRGIGLELSRQFLASGRNVIAACRDANQATELRELAPSPQLELVDLEVTSQESLSQLAAKLDEKTIDIVINNAGVFGPFDTAVGFNDVQGWLDTFSVNTIAPMQVTSALLPNLKASDRPKVITVSSQMGSLHREEQGALAYRTSKAAVNKAMQILSMELDEHDIIVCPVHPGWVQTDMGGSEADITVAESVSGLIQVIDSLKKEDSGKFLTWKGEEHPW